jgi:aminoglycoside phosphotransferase (APT) family kinase protein
MTGIPGFENFTRIRLLTKGWSSDTKYCVEIASGNRLLLRVADISEYNRKKAEFERMKQLAALGISMSQPVDFGICNDGKNVYSLLSWCGGEDAETALRHLPESGLYVLGIKSGEILRKMHSIPAPETQEDWAGRFNRKTHSKIQKYLECRLRFGGDDKIMKYMEKNRYLLENRPQCLRHGDYHIGNMILSDDNTLSIIDFNRMDYGDPWEEFNRIVWSAAASPCFATGSLTDISAGFRRLSFSGCFAFISGATRFPLFIGRYTLARMKSIP